MQLVQLVLTDDQALLTRQLIDLALSNSTEDQVGEVEADAQRLAVFFGALAAEPERFPVTGQMATALKLAKRQARGPAQTASRRNRRKVRQESRIGAAKRRRKERRETTEAYNAAVAAMEADRLEMEEAYAEKRAQLDAEPKFDVFDPHGNLILAGVPASMVQPVPFEKADPLSDPTSGQGHLSEPGLSQIIMPGSAEATQAQIEAKT